MFMYFLVNSIVVMYMFDAWCLRFYPVKSGLQDKRIRRHMPWALSSDDVASLRLSVWAVFSFVPLVIQISNPIAKIRITKVDGFIYRVILGASAYNLR